MPSCSLNHRPSCPHDYCDLETSITSVFCRPAASPLLSTAAALAASGAITNFPHALCNCKEQHPYKACRRAPLETALTRATKNGALG